MKISQSITVGNVARYTLLPGIVPRLRRFATTGFSALAYLMAVIYSSVRLLPPNHPYLVPANRGRYGLRHVVAEAYRNLVWKRENIDQILIFFGLLSGLVLLTMQVACVVCLLVVHHAFAMPGPFAGMFTTPNPKNDIALMLLDSVFGVPNLYNSCVSQGTCGNGWANGAFPTPFQRGMQSMVEFYSLAMLAVAVLIFLYYILIIVGETAQTGTPFGRRFDHIWAPMRLVVAIGMLVPLNFGYNGGQYIALIVARMGSGFATNAWILYNQSVSNAIGGAIVAPPKPNIPGTVAPPASANTNLIAQPVTPDVTPVVAFITLVESCKVAYETLYPPGANNGINIQPYMVNGNANPVQLTQGYSWQSALQYYNNKDVIIVFGDDGNGGGKKNAYPDEPGNIRPLCGSLTVQVKDTVLEGPNVAQAGYFDWVLAMFNDINYYQFGVRAGCIHLTPKPPDGNATNNGMGDCTTPNMGVAYDSPKEMPPDAWKQQQKAFETQQVQDFVNQAYLDMVNDTDFTVTQDILDRGWGGAGIWYNKIAQWNGALDSAVKTLPTVSQMPWIMEFVKNMRQGHDQNIHPDEIYDPNQGNQQDIRFGANDQKISATLNEVYKYWIKYNTTTEPEAKSQGNIIIDAIHMIFGVDGLYDIGQNDYVNPLVHLVMIGKSIMDGVVRNFIISTGFSAVGGMMEAMSEAGVQGGAPAMLWMSNIAMTFATMAISIGFTLYYLLPFMPFLYFYFAVGSWVKTVFEAILGVPLWALAHLKINGDGFPTESAIVGYLMIFEIFLRPILTVFGLLAAIAIFSAMARTLDEIFPLVARNVTGYDCSTCAAGGNPDVPGVKRGALDEFFFTIIYTILVYMMGTSSFKLIDQVPDNVMRWMGTNVQSFAGMVREDPGAHLAGYTQEAVGVISNQIMPAVPGAARGIGNAVGQGLKSAKPSSATVSQTGKN